MHKTVESTAKTSFKNARRCREKDKFYAAVDDPLGSAITGST